MLIHFNDLRKQSVRMEDIIHAIVDIGSGYYTIKLTVDLPKEDDFTGGKKREVRLYYDEDKSAMEADLKMLRATPERKSENSEAA